MAIKLTRREKWVLNFVRRFGIPILFKPEASMKESPAKIIIQQNTEGTWLRFESKSGLSALVHIHKMAHPESITGKAIQAWVDEQVNLKSGVV